MDNDVGVQRVVDKKKLTDVTNQATPSKNLTRGEREGSVKFFSIGNVKKQTEINFAAI